MFSHIGIRARKDRGCKADLKKLSPGISYLFAGLAGLSAAFSAVLVITLAATFLIPVLWTFPSPMLFMVG